MTTARERQLEDTIRCEQRAMVDLLLDIRKGCLSLFVDPDLQRWAEAAATEMAKSLDLAVDDPRSRRLMDRLQREAAAVRGQLVERMNAMAADIVAAGGEKPCR